MSKSKLRVTVTIDYTPDPKDYNPGSSLEDMAKVDLDNIRGLYDIAGTFENEPYEVSIKPVINSD